MFNIRCRDWAKDGEALGMTPRLAVDAMAVTRPRLIPEDLSSALRAVAPPGEDAEKMITAFNQANARSTLAEVVKCAEKGLQEIMGYY